jgi:hypothetical protein
LLEGLSFLVSEMVVVVIQLQLQERERETHTMCYFLSENGQQQLILPYVCMQIYLCLCACCGHLSACLPVCLPVCLSACVYYMFKNIGMYLLPSSTRVYLVFVFVCVGMHVCACVHVCMLCAYYLICWETSEEYMYTVCLLLL